MNLSGLQAEPTFVFLTLFPDQAPVSDKFTKATYEQLLRAIQGLDFTDCTAQRLLNDWIHVLRTFYSSESISPDHILLDHLRLRGPLEGNYLYFRSFVRGLALGDNPQVERTFRQSAQGRRYFGAIISKPGWHPGEMQEVDGRYQLDAKRDFNIHFQPLYYTTTNVFEMRIDYEVNPHQVAGWVKKHIYRPDYDAYNTIRNAFKAALKQRAITGLTVSGKTDQIAKVNLGLRACARSG